MPVKYEPLNARQTKAEMIKAYNELLKKLEEKAEAGLPEKKFEQQKKIEKDVVAKALTYTVESIVRDLADLNLGVGKAFSELSEQLIGEAGKLKEIQQAIVVQKANLEELHDINLAADTLSALVKEHEERRRNFESEMKEREEAKKRIKKEAEQRNNVARNAFRREGGMISYEKGPDGKVVRGRRTKDGFTPDP